MDNTDLDPQLLSQILLEPEFVKKSLIEEIVEWHSNLQPAISLTKRKISNFLLNPKQRLERSAKYVIQVLKKLYEHKCPRNFIRAYLGVIKENYEQIQSIINHETVRSEWKNIPIDILEVYISTFSPKISPEQQNQKFKSILDKGEYRQCLEFIKITANQKHHIEALLSKMTTNKEASKAADYIKELKLDPAEYPGIGERLYKNTARHFLSSNGWQYAQQIFEEHPSALATVVEDLVYKKKMDEALSIFNRHKLKQYIQKPSSLELLEKHLSQLKVQDNYLHKDEFQSSNPKKYLSLKDFKLSQQDVIWVDDHHPQLDHILKIITTAPIVGIDTESIVGQTKLQRATNEPAAVIQIATNKKIFLFDGFQSRSQKIRTAFISLFTSDVIKVGHSLTNDTEPLLKSIQYHQKIVINNLVDVWKLFKKLYPKQKYSSLAFICQKVLGKEICKQQTLTNWKRRPLRKNQMHYAALDAFVVIKIYEDFLDKFGEMVSYYCEMDNQDM